MKFHVVQQRLRIGIPSTLHCEIEKAMIALTNERREERVHCTTVSSGVLKQDIQISIHIHTTI